MLLESKFKALILSMQIYYQTSYQTCCDNINFTEFYLFLSSHQYFISSEILESKSLTILHLKGCCDRNYVGNIEELPSLKATYFDFVCISQDTSSNLIHNWPSIVELTLIECSSLNSILVPPHLNQLKGSCQLWH